MALELTGVAAFSYTPFEKLKSHYKRMLKVELINNLKGAYYRVDLRIK